MPVTPQMNLTLPTVLSTAGPAYATQVNAALTQIDGHTHAPGQGTPVVAAGLNINGDVSWHSNSLTFAKAVGFASQTAVPGAGQATASIYVLNGELSYRSASGVDTPITASGVVRATNGFFGDYATYGAQASYTNATLSYALANPDTSLAKLNCGAIACTNLAASGTLGATGNATLGGTLNVTGATTLAGLTAGASSLGAITSTGNLALGANSVTCGPITSTGAMALNSGNLTLNTGNVITTAGNISAGGSLGCSGNVNFAGTSTNTFTVASVMPTTMGQATFSGPVVANGGVNVGASQSVSTPALTVSNSASIAAATLSGITTLAGTLTNTGTSSFKAVLGPFYLAATAIGAGATTQALQAGALNSAVYPYVTPFAGSIVGISAWSTASATSTLTFAAVRNGAATGLTAAGSITTTSSGLRNTGARGTYALVAGDNLRVDVTSSVAATVSTVAWLIVEMAP